MEYGWEWWWIWYGVVVVNPILLHVSTISPGVTPKFELWIALKSVLQSSWTSHILLYSWIMV